MTAPESRQGGDCHPHSADEEAGPERGRDLPKAAELEDTGGQFFPFGVHVLSLQLWGQWGGEGPRDTPRRC